MKKLERKLGLAAIIAISIAGMLGGIFVIPGIAAAKTGSSIWLAFLLAAICILPAVFSKSELATAMPTSGGAYIYIERALGPLFGTISGIGLWISLLLKSAFALVGFGAYLFVLVDLPTHYIKFFAIGSLFLITILNIFGVKKVGKVQVIIVSLSLISLLSLLFLGIPSVDPQLLEPFKINGNTGLISTIAFVFVAYAGVTKIAAIAGEVVNPKKNIPLAMLISLFSITLIYIFISYNLVGNIHLSNLSTDIKPMYSLALIVGGQWFAYIIAIIGVITLISMANSGVLASSRFPFAMAMDKLLPVKLSKIHEKYLTPINTILLTCFVMSLVIMFLDVEKIAKLASAFKASMFIMVNLCVIILRETAVQWYKPTYKSPFYPYIQIFGIVSGLILLFYLGWMPIISLIVIGVIGAIIYYFYGVKASRSGVLRNYGKNPAKFIFQKNKSSIDYKLDNNNQDKEHNDWLDGQINPNAGVIIPLLGNEYSPESLIELGSSLNQRKKLQVISIKEVPDQTFLDAVLEETPKIKALKRKLSVVEKINDIDLDFESVVTHNVAKTMQSLSNHTKSKWLVLSWNGRMNNGFLIKNPVGWIVSNIDTNFALFKDEGVRYIKKIILAVRPGSKHFEELIKTTHNISLFYKAELTILHVLNSNDKVNLDDIETESKSILDKYNSNHILKIVESDDPIEYVSEISSDYDLLVMGTPAKETWMTLLFGSGQDKFATTSNCSVLRLTLRN